MNEYIAGVDIGNATTETALGCIEDGRLVCCVSGIASTTGVKGTMDNLEGVRKSLKMAMDRLGIDAGQLNLIRINEATPVIGDFAMETITETIITESTLIGHNPDTPGGLGTGFGISFRLDQAEGLDPETEYIAVVTGIYDFEDAARDINRLCAGGINIRGAIVKKDDGVLIHNRLDKKMPILDEVEAIERIPLGMPCAIEVAQPGGSIDLLSNPYGIATLFGLGVEETRQIMPIAKALIGNRSAVVIKTPEGAVRERRIPAGEIMIAGQRGTTKTQVDLGGEAIMAAVRKAGEIKDVTGSRGTNVGGMLETVRKEMAQLTGQPIGEIRIKDLLAVDTIVPREVAGNLAHEFSMEKAVGIAAMVKTHKLHMENLAAGLEETLGVPVEVGGVEGSMAVRGALTTPGTEKPLLVLDIGAGSTDACMIYGDGSTKPVHLAGAGNMVTMMIGSELGISDRELAEDIKKYPLAKVESLYHIRHEDGNVQFFEEAMDSSLYANLVILKPEGWKILRTRQSMEKIRKVRREAKERILIQNVIRALRRISLTDNLNEFEHVVLVGGSSLDFELGNMVTETLAHFGIVSGKANVRAVEGPRNAVATGLLLHYLEGQEDGKHGSS